LLEQLTWMQLSDEQYQIAHYLILNINKQGYLVLTDKEIAEHFDLDEAKAIEMKNILHRLEPCGIGASNVSDCLAIQAREKFPDHTLLHTLIEEQLTALADKQWEKIAKQYAITLAEVKDVFEQIQSLNPRPAAEFGEAVDYVSPDITITFDEEEQIHRVQLNDHYIPNLHFNRDYSNAFSDSKEVSQYVNSHLKK